MDEEWIEVRSTLPGRLDTLGVGPEIAPETGRRYDGCFNVVSTPQRNRSRTIPTLYWGALPLFGSRHEDEVLDRLAVELKAVRAATTEPIYRLQPCSVDGRRGIYVVDLYNRSPYRMRLERSGMEFAQHPHVRLIQDGSLSSDDWGTFVPDFAILRGDGPNEATLFSGPRGMSLFFLLSRRIGHLGPDEPALMSRLLQNLDVLVSEDAGALVDFVRS